MSSTKTTATAPVAEKPASSAVTPDFTALLSDDVGQRAKVQETLKAQLAEEQAKIESATKRAARIEALLGAFDGSGNSAAPTETPNKPKSKKGAPVSNGDATKAEVYAAVKNGPKEGMASASIRSALDGKKVGDAIALLVEEGKIDRLPGGHGAGTKVRLAKK